MKKPSIAAVLPGIVLLFFAFLAMFWFSRGHSKTLTYERVPVPDISIAPITSAASQPSQVDASIGTESAAPAELAPLVVSAQGTPSISGAQVPKVAGEWPRFRGPNFDNISVESIPLAASWSAGEPKMFWSLNLGEGYAGAAVWNSRVYILDYDQAAQSDVLRCLAFADGKELWRQSYSVSVKRNHGMSRTTPALAGGFVVSLGPKCHVLCADALTGKVHWIIDLVKEYGTVVPDWYAGQCPLIDNGRAIIAPGGSALLIAVDCATGKVLWKTPNPNGWKMTHSSILPIEFKGKPMYVYCASEGVVGVSAKDGTVMWQMSDWKVKIANVPTPIAVPGNRLLFTGGYNAGSLMVQLVKSGDNIGVKQMWKCPATVFGSDQQTPIYYNGYVYGVIPGGQLVCLDVNGKQVWASGLGSRFGLGSYMIAGGNIFVMNDTGVLTLAEASPKGFRQLGRSRILQGHDAWGPLAITGGRLIARDLTRMVCLKVSRD